MTHGLGYRTGSRRCSISTNFWDATKIDILTADVSMSILSLPALIPRIIVFAILAGVFMAINAAYTALSDDSGSTGTRTLKVLGTWLLLTAMQVFILLAGIGKYMD